MVFMKRLAVCLAEDCAYSCGQCWPCVVALQTVGSVEELCGTCATLLCVIVGSAEELCGTCATLLCVIVGFVQELCVTCATLLCVIFVRDVCH